MTVGDDSGTGATFANPDELSAALSLSAIPSRNGSSPDPAIPYDNIDSAARRGDSTAGDAAEDSYLTGDVADAVIRGLFDTGLRLRSLAPRTDEPVRDELIMTIEAIDKVIRDLRDVIVAPDPTAADDRRLAAEDRRRAAQYLAETYRDDVTGALSRRPGRERLQDEIDRARRTSTPLAVLFFDVDGLKQVNDWRGHRRGDELLAAAGSALRSSLRSYDVVVRYGGDEFVCALPGETARTARDTIDRVRYAFAQLVPGSRMSAGHAQLMDDDTMDDVIERADVDLNLRRAQRTQSDVRPRQRRGGQLANQNHSN